MGRIIGILMLATWLVGTNAAAAGESHQTRLPIAIYDRAGATVVVESGDHLWKISARHLEGSHRPVGPYWSEVIHVNTPRLRSGDPDLIYPGEVIELP